MKYTVEMMIDLPRERVIEQGIPAARYGISIDINSGGRVMPCEPQLRCEACDRVHDARDLRPDARDDTRCPYCHSLRLEPIIERREGVLGFFVQYHRA